jgi:hypothetical protein
VNAQILETWHRHYLLDGRAKGPKVGLHLRIDRGHSGIESVDLIEMKAKQEALVKAPPANLPKPTSSRLKRHPCQPVD